MEFLKRIQKKRLIAKLIVFARYFYLSYKYPFSDVYDVRDPRDYRAVDKLKAIHIDLPDFVDIFEETNQEEMNQFQEPSCTALGTTLLKRMADAYEHGRLILHSWQWLWEKQGKPQNGDWLHRSFQVSVKNPFQTEGKLWPWLGYATVKDKIDVSPEALKDMKKCLAKRIGIKTGISIKDGPFYEGDIKFRDNMARAAHTGILLLNEGRSLGGHDLTIAGYDEKGVLTGVPGWILYTCWGKWGKWKTGRMVLPYDQTIYLYSTYRGYDAKDLIEVGPA